MIAEYKEQFPSDEYKITRLLDKISLMTPENIHINTFMYEPLIDMSIIHLVKLYELVKSEKDRIEQLQFNGWRPLVSGKKSQKFFENIEV